MDASGKSATFSGQTRYPMQNSARRLNAIVWCLRSNADVSDDLHGHVLRMDQGGIAKTPLRWSPPGKGKRGKPKTTWRWTVMAEMADLGLRPNMESNRHSLRPTGDKENQALSRHQLTCKIFKEALRWVMRQNDRLRSCASKWFIIGQ